MLASVRKPFKALPESSNCAVQAEPDSILGRQAQMHTKLWKIKQSQSGCRDSAVTEAVPKAVTNQEQGVRG